MRVKKKTFSLLIGTIFASVWYITRFLLSPDPDPNNFKVVDSDPNTDIT